MLYNYSLLISLVWSGYCSCMFACVYYNWFVIVQCFEWIESVLKITDNHDPITNTTVFSRLWPHNIMQQQEGVSVFSCLWAKWKKIPFNHKIFFETGKSSFGKPQEVYRLHNLSNHILFWVGGASSWPGQEDTPFRAGVPHPDPAGDTPSWLCGRGTPSWPDGGTTWWGTPQEGTWDQWKYYGWR